MCFVFGVVLCLYGLGMYFFNMVVPCVNFVLVGIVVVVEFEPFMFCFWARPVGRARCNFILCAICVFWFSVFSFLVFFVYSVVVVMLGLFVVLGICVFVMFGCFGMFCFLM